MIRPRRMFPQSGASKMIYRFYDVDRFVRALGRERNSTGWRYNGPNPAARSSVSPSSRLIATSQLSRAQGSGNDSPRTHATSRSVLILLRSCSLSLGSPAGDRSRVYWFTGRIDSAQPLVRRGLINESPIDCGSPAPLTLGRDLDKSFAAALA